MVELVVRVVETHKAVASLSMSFEHSASGKEDEDVYCVSICFHSDGTPLYFGRYGSIFLQLGLYYVCPEWRNSGIGSVLFDKMMAIGGHANMALHGGFIYSSYVHFLKNRNEEKRIALKVMCFF